MGTTLSNRMESLFQTIRINFLFNHPFLSVLALSIPTHFQANTRSAFQTNGYQVTIDTERLRDYSEEEITYLYAHTLLHIVLKHPFRQKTREPNLWNQSCDIVTNLILDDFSDIGSMPLDEQLDHDLKGKCVEEVYDILYEEEQEKQESESSTEESQEQEAKTEANPKGKHKTHIYNPHRQDLDEVENQQSDQGEREKLDGIIIQALNIANRSTHQYSGLQVEIDTLIQPELSLHDQLKEFLIASLFEKRLSYTRPNRRYIHQNLYLPGYQKHDERVEFYIALDSSSSVSLEEYKKFLGIVQEICEEFYEYQVTVLPFDIKVKEQSIIQLDSLSPWSSDALRIPKSDGGTNFDALLHYLKTTSIRSDNILMVLSDGEFEIHESLVSQTLFILNEPKNRDKFRHLGRTIVI